MFDCIMLFYLWSYLFLSSIGLDWLTVYVVFFNALVCMIMHTLFGRLIGKFATMVGLDGNSTESPPLLGMANGSKFTRQDGRCWLGRGHIFLPRYFLDEVRCSYASPIGFHGFFSQPFWPCGCRVKVVLLKL